MTKIEKAQYHFDKAIAAYKRGDYHVVRNNLEKAIRYNPNYAKAYYNLATLLWKYFQEYEKAKKYYEKAIELNPNFTEVYYNLATLHYTELKDVKSAQKNLMLAIEQKPNFDFARKYLGSISNFKDITFISELEVKKVRHHRNITIELSKTEKKHLFLTGKNGSGKTSILKEAQEYMQSILQIPVNEVFTERGEREFWNFDSGNKFKFNVKQNLLDLRVKYEAGAFLIVFFGDQRQFQPDVPQHIKKVELQLKNLPKDDVSKDFIKYLVYQDYKRLRINGKEKEKIDKLFEKTEAILRLIYKEDKLKFSSGIEQDELDFYITLNNGNSFTFNQLAAGYSAIFKIIFEIILRTQNKQELSDTEGVVLIDEPETHLHIGMQKEIMPILIKLFPKIQFIVATHSPFVLNSVANAVVYDLETKKHFENASELSYDSLVEYHFTDNQFLAQRHENMERYIELAKLFAENKISEQEEAELSDLDIHFGELSPLLSPDLFLQYRKIHKTLQE